MIKTAPYDSAEFLHTPEAVQHYMDEALATGDPAFIAHALGTVARAHRRHRPKDRPNGAGESHAI